MKTIFYTILFVSVLCCGFSVHAQDNESESKFFSCILENGDCKEFNFSDGMLFYGSGNYLYFYYHWHLGLGKYIRELKCLYQNYHEGKRCSELTSLKGLDMSKNYLSELPVGLFSGFSSLQMLDLRGNPLLQAEKDRIRKALPHVSEIYF